LASTAARGSAGPDGRHVAEAEAAAAAAAEEEDAVAARAAQGFPGRRARHAQLADLFAGTWAGRPKRYRPAPHRCGRDVSD